MVRTHMLIVNRPMTYPSEADFHLLLDALTQCVLLHDAQTKAIVWANRAACVALGFSLEELLPLRAHHMTRDDAQVPPGNRGEGDGALDRARAASVRMVLSVARWRRHAFRSDRHLCAFAASARWSWCSFAISAKKKPCARSCAAMRRVCGNICRISAKAWLSSRRAGGGVCQRVRTARAGRRARCTARRRTRLLHARGPRSSGGATARRDSP